MKLTEEEIRPEKIFNEYLALAAKDSIDYFTKGKRDQIKCHVCDDELEINWIIKQGFEYKKCPKCHSILVSPRPKAESFNAYYKDSPSTKFWATTFYQFTESARREKLWKPKSKLIKEKIELFQGDKPIQTIIDIGGGYGVFDEEIKKITPLDIMIIEPSIHLAKICRQKGFNVIEKFMESIDSDEIPSTRNCFVSFELFEHLHDPTAFLKSLSACMNTGDLFIFTTLSGMGIDIQLLKENAKAVSPPHHLNFFNPKSIQVLLEKNGFEVYDVATPGKLDMDILKNSYDKIQDPYWKTLLDYSTEKDLDKLQSLIVESKLSSHMMICCQKNPK